MAKYCGVSASCSVGVVALPLTPEGWSGSCDAERLLFRQTTSAHPLVRVFLSRYDFGQRPAHALTPRHTFTEKFGARRTFYLKISTITAGHLAMQVMSVRSAESNELVPASEIEFEFCGTARDAVIAIWPSVPAGISFVASRSYDEPSRY